VNWADASWSCTNCMKLGVEAGGLDCWPRPRRGGTGTHFLLVGFMAPECRAAAGFMLRSKGMEDVGLAGLVAWCPTVTCLALLWTKATCIYCTFTSLCRTRTTTRTSPLGFSSYFHLQVPVVVSWAYWYKYSPSLTSPTSPPSNVRKRQPITSPRNLQRLASRPTFLCPFTSNPIDAPRRVATT
jgi:hypothetical protein